MKGWDKGWDKGWGKGWGKFPGAKGKFADGFYPMGGYAYPPRYGGSGKGTSKGSENPECKVFVGDLPYSSTWQDLKDHFAQVGTVLYTKIIMDHWKGMSKGMSANRDGWSKGMGLVEFSSAEEAQLAIKSLNGSKMKDRDISVEPWTSYDGPKGSSKGSTNAKRGSQNASCKVYVGGLPYRTTWKDLKDYFSQAGTVAYTRINCDNYQGMYMRGANPDGWSKGTGIVEFSSPEEASKAITLLNGSTMPTQMGSRTIVVDKWLD